MPPLHLDTQVLCVCKQIHQDASLLPYQENAFPFKSTSALEGFLGKVGKEQAGCIKRLAIQFLHHRRDDGHVQLVQQMLYGVKELVIFVGLHASSGHDKFKKEEYREAVYTSFLQYGRLPALSSAVVAAFNVAVKKERYNLMLGGTCGHMTRSIHRRRRFDPEMVARWGEDVENGLRCMIEERSRSGALSERSYADCPAQ